MSMYYFHYSSRTMDSCSPDKPAYAEARATWLCHGCCRPYPETQRIDTRIEDDEIDGPLNMLNGCGVALAYKPFLMRFGEERVRQNLNVGRVYDPNGRLLSDWVTFIGKHVLIVRGNEHAKHRVCSNCGRNLYFAMGRKYLFPQPPQGIDLFESDLWGLIVPESVAETLDISESNGIWIEKLPVLDEPLDGLPPLTP